MNSHTAIQTMIFMFIQQLTFFPSKTVISLIINLMLMIKLIDSFVSCFAYRYENNNAALCTAQKKFLEQNSTGFKNVCLLYFHRCFNIHCS